MFQIERSLISKQQFWFNRFDECLQKRLSYLKSSKDRGWGKTTVLNEIGFIYQALGYNVILVTQFPNSNEHYACLLFDNIFLKSVFLSDYSKTIVIVDEYDYQDSNFRDIVEFFNDKKIPYVGFVRF